MAIDALEASGAVLPDLDPVVIALRAAYVMFDLFISQEITELKYNPEHHTQTQYAVEHAAWVFAEEALKTLGNDVSNAIQWIETQIVKLADLFNIEQISVVVHNVSKCMILVMSKLRVSYR